MWLLKSIYHSASADIHREDSEEKESLEVEICEESHHCQETEVLYGAVQDTQEESEGENCDFGEQVLGNVPTFPGQTLSNPDLDIKMRLCGNNTPSDDQGGGQ